MEKFIQKNIYKTRPPYDTIQLIRRILFDYDIFITEISTHHKESDTYSTLIKFGDEAFSDVLLSTNGKGMTPRFALASAYGEFAERLENGILLNRYRLQAYKQGVLKYRFAPDETEIKLGSVGSEGREIIKDLYLLDDTRYEESFGEFSDVPVKMLPYTDAFSGNQVYIPYELLLTAVGSNGMCAGNTKEEALSQGISELFERQSLALIYGENRPLKLLPKEAFSGSAVMEKLKHLESLGFESKILDASMGLEYPVTGLVLKNEDGTMMVLGADPNPIVALERCLTEMFQVIGSGNYKFRQNKTSCGLLSNLRFLFMQDIYHKEFEKALHSGSGQKPDNVMNMKEEYSPSYTYNKNNLNDFEYLSSLIRKLGYHLYYRDFSFMGFPAYHALIPEISFGDYSSRKTVIYARGRLAGRIADSEPDIREYEALIPLLKKMEQSQENFYL